VIATLGAASDVCQLVRYGLSHAGVRDVPVILEQHTSEDGIGELDQVTAASEIKCDVASSGGQLVTPSEDDPLARETELLCIFRERLNSSVRENLSL